MITAVPEVRIVENYRISCDGGESVLGHPRIWLQIPKDRGWIECPYCDCKMIHADFADKVSQ
ncbi:MAG: zinc-finger domain-containing protein [Aestuariivita sp.]|nr:zinc-finger domain-containing protein [Aestuariivita sp.]